jgi:hypothetical protein
VPKINGLPDVAETRAFRAVCRVLRNDPTLRAVGLKFRDWQDTPKDVAPVAIDEMPLLELTPSVLPGGWWSEGEQQTNLDVDGLFYLPGTHADNVTNFLGAIRAAMWPTDPARRAIVEGEMSPVCVNGKVGEVAVTVITPDEGARYTVGKFSLRLLLLNVT